MHDEFYSLTGKLKNISNSLYGFSSVGEGVATRRLPCLRYGSHYLEVAICHRWTLLSVNPKFSGWKNFENRQKHQKRRSACVGQADFGKLELNNIRNDSGNCQCLSVKRDQFETRSIRNKRGRMFRPSRFLGRTKELLSLAILGLLRIGCLYLVWLASCKT